MTSARTRARLVARLRRGGIRDARVLAVIGAIPRHVFVDEALAQRAYEDTALPIAHGQTISQPWVVARMTEALLGSMDDPRSARILEIGTGSGYQTAVLADLFGEVYSVERIEALTWLARDRLGLLGTRNVQLRVTDGYDGWPEAGPFDGIIVTAAPDSVPAMLGDQLVEGGAMVVPVGDGDAQELLLLQREGDRLRRSVLDLVRFVPMLKGIRRSSAT